MSTYDNARTGNLALFPEPSSLPIFAFVSLVTLRYGVAAHDCGGDGSSVG